MMAHNVLCETAKTDRSKCECECEGEFHGRQASLDRFEKLAVCECVFDDEDPNNEGYSMTEFDLSPHAGPEGVAFSIRHNKEKGHYEIFNYLHDDPYTDEAVHYRYRRLEDAIRTANEIEKARWGEEHLQYGHDPERYPNRSEACRRGGA